MIKVNSSHEADLTITASTSGLWVRGRVGGQNIVVTLSGAGVVKGFLLALEKMVGTFAVFDMTERVLK